MILFCIIEQNKFDIIIIGGGATGAGIALDASLRGLSVALFEQNDFAEGTSSRSTKLVHGGVRYLEAAIKKLDRAQYALVKESLKERRLFLQNASHLSRPLVVQDDSKDTSQMIREHIEEFSSSGLLTIAEGKWTSYRSMAESAVDLAIQKLEKPKADHLCQTQNYKVVGSQSIVSPHIPSHLHNLYGDRSQKILDIAISQDASQKLHPSLHTSKAELIYCIRYEYVQKPMDFITRRSNIALVDIKLATDILDTVLDIMKKELYWSKERYDQYKAEALQQLNSAI